MLRACQVILDQSNDGASWQNPTTGDPLIVTGNASIDGNLTVTGDIFADDITYDVNTCNILNVNEEIRHLNNDTNRIAFDVDKMTLDASGTSIVLDDTAMADKIVVTGQTRFDDLAKFEDITIQDNITHDGDTDTRIAFADNQISIQTGGVSAIQSTVTNTTISPQLTIVNASGAPKLRAVMGGVGVNEQNRFAIQTTQTDGNSRFYVLPNGTGSIAATNYANVSDLTAAEQRRADIGMVANEFRCSASNIGPGPTASKTPFTWRVDNTEVMRMDGSGNLTVNSSTARTEPLSVNDRTGATLRFAVKDPGQVHLEPLGPEPGPAPAAPANPTSATEGDMYYDNYLQKVRNYDGANWYQFDNHLRTGSGVYPTDYDVLMIGDQASYTEPPTANRDVTPNAGARTDINNPATAVPQQGIVLKARGQIQWNSSISDGGPSCTIFRTTNSAELVLAYGWRNGLDGVNWQSSQTSNAMQRSAVHLGNGAVRFYVNPAQSGTAGSPTGVTPQQIMSLTQTSTIISQNSATTVIYQQSLSGLSPSNPIVCNVECGRTNPIYALNIDSASYIAGSGWYNNSVARGYVFSGAIYGASLTNLSAFGITVAVSYNSDTSLRVTFTDSSGNANNKVGTARITITTS